MIHKTCWPRWIVLAVLTVWAMSVPFGCKKQEDAKSGVVGHLQVESGSPEGATAMLFEDPSRGFDDLSVWHVTNHQPAVGFSYNPQVGFEWRGEMGINGLWRASAPVGANGEFNITGQAEGPYFLVVQKQGYGWTAPMRLNLNQPTVDVGALQLFPEEILSGTTQGSRLLLSNHHYVVPEFSRYYVGVGDTLRLQAGAVVRGDDGAEIRVQGFVVSQGEPDNWCVFTTNLATRLGQDDWEGIRFLLSGGNPSSGRFSYTRFSNCDHPINTDAADCEVDHCYFGNVFGQAVDVSNGKTSITRCIFDHINRPVRAYQPDTLRMEHSIIFSAKDLGAEFRVVNGGSIFCNWFEDCGQLDTTQVAEVGVIMLQDCQNIDISRNNFLTSWYALLCNGWVRSTVNIHHNRFDRMQRVMDIRDAPREGPSNPVFGNNCLMTVDNFYIFIHACAAYDTLDVSAPLTYWNTVSEIEAHNKINDCRDNPNCPCVDISPIAGSCPDDAGICAE